ncbi:PSD1 and planctomycete cytochrome C domain-containing protein [Neorhodopirellula pilleata]|nr:PSD1 and planctomycete cytochrome C domain-containing protein [Neorhodopirellula pilleata]
MGRSFPITRLDQDNDGELTLEEFRKIGEFVPRLQAENANAATFAGLDQNNDSAIDAREFERLFTLRRDQTRADLPFDPIAGPVAGNPLRAVLPNFADESLDEVTPAQAKFFHDRIEPVLTAKCYSCHSELSGQLRGSLRLDDKHHLRRGGASGSILDEDPADSLLVMALHGEDFSLMPPKGRLPDNVIKDFETWVSMNAPDPRESEDRPVEVELPESSIDWEGGRAHWSYQQLRPSQRIETSSDPWSTSTIDRYLYDAMKQRGLNPVADASRGQLIRRVSLDLTGLPPTPEQVERFVNDSRDDAAALNALVDRLLESPQFGEHWGRHWLDVARFAESSGKEVNIFYPFAWRYRDYVINAFNNDTPYDRFITEQLAGDLIAAKDSVQKAQSIIATGYLAIGPKSHIQRDQRQFLLDVIDEQVDAVSRGIMGMTIACARCHDHKFDAVSQKDYYALAGIFASSEALFGGARTVQVNRTTGLIELPRFVDLPVGATMTSREREFLERQLEQTEQMPATQAGRVAKIVRTATLKSKLSHYDDDGNARKLVMCTREADPIDLPVFLRGELDRPSEIVTRGFPTVIEGPELPEIHEGSGRLDLAAWLTDPNHPLTARVMVNRVWQHLFGRGLVATPDNFGTTGRLPSHPELLDYLAKSFIDQGWSVKTLIREMVSTRAYRLDSTTEAANESIDPDNVYLWKHPRKRLPAESIRDSVLHVCGTLDLEPPVGSPVLRLGEGQVRSLERFRGRAGFGMMGYAASETSTQEFPELSQSRSVYLPVLRDHIDPILDAFDFPDASLVTGERETTTVASQSLFFMNDPFAIENATHLARSLIHEFDSTQQRVEAAFETILARSPRADERKLAIGFIDQSKRTTPIRAWTLFCQSLMATAEFRSTP